MTRSNMQSSSEVNDGHMASLDNHGGRGGGCQFSHRLGVVGVATCLGRRETVVKYLESNREGRGWEG